MPFRSCSYQPVMLSLDFPRARWFFFEVLCLELALLLSMIARVEPLTAAEMKKAAKAAANA